MGEAVHQGETQQQVVGGGGGGGGRGLLTGLDGFKRYKNISEGDFRRRRGRGFGRSQSHVQECGSRAGLGVVERLRGESGLRAERARLVLEVSQGGLGLLLVVPDTNTSTSSTSVQSFRNLWMGSLKF